VGTAEEKSLKENFKVLHESACNTKFQLFAAALIDQGISKMNFETLCLNMGKRHRDLRQTKVHLSLSL